MGREGSTGQILSRNAPAWANFSSFSSFHGPLSPPTPQLGPCGCSEPTSPTPSHPELGGCLSLAWERWSPRVAAGGSPRPPWGWGLPRPRPGLGGAGRRGGREGCVREAGGREATAPGDAADLCCAESPRAWPRLSSRNDDEMRGGGTGVALLASVLWVAARCQQRGEPQSPVPLLPGAAAGQSPTLCRFLGRCAHPRSPPTGGSDTWVLRSAPGKSISARRDGAWGPHRGRT